MTGSSSGLGRACALDLAQQGFRVLAGVRSGADGEALRQAAPGGAVHPLILDVTDDETVATAAAQAADLVGPTGLWGLVNNAGVVVSAPLECVPLDELRRQLDINVVGQVRVIQAFLPLLRRARGRIVNVTSGLGSLALPYMGPYAASQFAKEAVSDALRRELRPFGVSVSIVQPGAIWTPIWDKTREGALGNLDRADRGVADLYRTTFVNFLGGNEALARASRTTTGDFAAAVREALTAARPKTRYPIGADVKKARLMLRLLPTSAFDKQLAPIVTPPAATAGEPVATTR
ncbi:SDR family NAD(P)-dependent oxidoreductase [Micromonospora sp. B11E3]|uniref:SDR family NAD(P)-dependent oxidoreductase n=1 Tax=Micromonospora sp. B11E3 TaxID=3153562 RepID=UPI00325D7746